MRLALVAAAVAAAAAQSSLAQDPGTTLDFLAGEWTLHDPSGGAVGTSTIVVQAPGAMLFEKRRVGDDGAQPLWFANMESDKGWVQLFVGASGQVRAFRTVSQPGAWPLVMSGDVILRDGRPARFRLTMTRASDDSTRRLLERSMDGGASWQAVFDYSYRRSTAK